MPITFHTADISYTLKQKRLLKCFIGEQITAARLHLGHLSFVFCTDDYLLNINRQFLKHDYYTDIITFPLNEESGTIAGEIYISIERVLDNAETFKAKTTEKPIRTITTHADFFEIELHRVMFHGILHLIGYKDKTTPQKAQMRKMEDRWLHEFQQTVNRTDS